MASTFSVHARCGFVAAGQAGQRSRVSRDQSTALATDPNNATFVLEVDTSNLALGDLLEIRVYTVTLSGGSTHLPAALHQRAGVRRGPLLGELAPGRMLGS